MEFCEENIGNYVFTVVLSSGSGCLELGVWRRCFRLQGSGCCGLTVARTNGASGRPGIRYRQGSYTQGIKEQMRGGFVTSQR